MRPLVLAIALLALLAVPSQGAAGDVIQPGDRMLVGGATNCTLSFVYDGQGADAGRVFMSIASHCVGSVGETMHTDNFPAFGEVVYKGDASATATDIALIEVDPAHAGAVVGEVRGHPGFPTGVAVAGATSAGDVVLMSGWGTGFGGHEVTREERGGLLLRHEAVVARIEGPVSPGDSGGPWLLADGRALAIVSKISATVACCGPLDASVHQEGPTVEAILAAAAAAGFDVALRTA